MRHDREAEMYKQETRGVVIRVRSNFLENESEPDESRFVWSYTVEIENTSPEPVQLMAREWHITDALNRTEVIRGPGVIGEQPVIEPGERFRYTSGAPLPTSTGFMAGAYTMASQSGETFAAAIPAFALDSPFDAGTLH